MTNFNFQAPKGLHKDWTFKQEVGFVIIGLAGTGGIMWLRRNFKIDEERAKADEKIRVYRAKTDDDIRADNAKTDNDIRARNAGNGNPGEESTAEPETYSQPKTAAEFLAGSQGGKIDWIVPRYFAAGQISALIAGADAGKSTAALSIAVSVAKGEKIPFIEATSEAPRKTDSLYYVLEPRFQEWENRIKDVKVIPDNVRFVKRTDLPIDSFDGFLRHFEATVSKATSDLLVCVDPITKFPDYDIDKFYPVAEKLRNELNRRGITLSVIVTMHADEIKDWNEISTSDIRGGDRAIQQLDGAVVLRKERRMGEYRFFQQMKKPKCYEGHETVTVVKFSTDGGYTHFEYEEESSLKDAMPLKPRPAKEEGQESGQDTSMETVMDKKMKACAMLQEIDPQTQKKKYTQEQVAQFFQITTRTLQNWNKEVKQYLTSLQPAVACS